MIKIAVCDDDINLCRHIEKILCERFTKIIVECFDVGSVFLEALDTQNYDIVLLDIVFDGKALGTGIGSAIRDKYKNDYTQIIYISSYEEYAMSLFDTHPLNFLLKPIDKEKLCKVVEKAMDLCNYSGNVLMFKSFNNTLRIPYKDIIYITKNKRKMIIVTTKGKYEGYGKLSDINLEFGPEKFIRIHNSIIINSYYVRAYYSNEVLMSTGERLAISRTYQKEIKAMLMEV